MNITSTIRPAGPEKPAFNPDGGASGGHAAMQLDETVIGLDADLAEILRQRGLGLEGVGAGVADAGAWFRPGYGVAETTGGALVFGAGIGRILVAQATAKTGSMSLSNVQQQTGGEADEESDPLVQRAERAYQLELTEQRVGTAGLVTEGVETVMKLTGHDLTGDAAFGFDVLQMTLGGAGFATSLQKEGWSIDTSLAGAGFAADALTAAAHLVPGLKEAVPYANAVSFVLKVAKRTRADKPVYVPPQVFDSVRNRATGEVPDVIRVDAIWG